MSYVHVEGAAGAVGLGEALSRADRFALDCEAAGFHRYSDRLCLVQITVGEETYVVDTLAFDLADMLRVPLEDPAIEVVMHGADFDLRLLRRDLGLKVRGLFDTQVAASLLGEPGIGLAALLETRFGIKVSKKYQRADWAARPLSAEMLEYAAGDTRELLELADLLRADLRAVGREGWVEEECRWLEQTPDQASDEGPDDPVTRVKGARSLGPRQVAGLREALRWRDAIARRLDRAPFRVVGDGPLLEVARTRRERPGELAAIKGFPTGLAKSDGPKLIDRLRWVATVPEAELEGYPPPSRQGPGRPTPEVETLYDRLKDVRNRRADELKLDRGTLLPNATLLAIAWARPQTPEQFAAVDGMRAWQQEAVGADLLAVTRQKR